MNLVALLLQSDVQAPSTAMMLVPTLVSLAILVVMIAAMWKVFEKAGEPGWAAIIPIYNILVLIKIAGKPMWWVILFLIPLVNFIVAIITMIALARNFGKGTGFALGLTFLGIIFFPMLAWGDATYHPQMAA